MIVYHSIEHSLVSLIHWGRVSDICIGKLTIIGSDNGLSPELRQVIIWTNAGILLIAPLGTNFSEILIKIQTFSLKKIRLKMSSVKWCLFGLGLNELTHCRLVMLYNIIHLCKHCLRQWVLTCLNAFKNVACKMASILILVQTSKWYVSFVRLLAFLCCL